MWLNEYTLHMYRVSHQVSDLGWVDFDFGYSIVSRILLALGADGKLAELAEQLGKMSGTFKSKSTQPRSET